MALALALLALLVAFVALGVALRPQPARQRLRSALNLPPSGGTAPIPAPRKA